MSCCINLEILAKRNLTFCKSYEIKATPEGSYIGVRITLCDGGIRTFLFPVNDTQIVCSSTKPTKTAYGQAELLVEDLGVCTEGDFLRIPEPLDLPEGFSIKETKTLTELSLGKLKFDYSLASSELYATPKNFNLLKTYFSPNILDNYYKDIPGRITVGSHHKLVKLHMASFREQVKIDIRSGENDWAKSAAKLKISSLDFGQYSATSQHFHDVISDHNIYDGFPFWYPLADYNFMMWDPTIPGGPSRDPRQYIVPTGFWRPWFYVTAILEAGFCALGYDFDSYLYYSEVGRKQIAYLIDENFGIEPERTKVLDAKMSVGSFYTLAFPYLNDKAAVVKFPVLDYDFGNNLETQNGYYIASGEVHITGVVKIEASQEIDLTVSLAYFIEGDPTGVHYRNIDTKEFKKVSANSITDYSFDVEFVPTSHAFQICVIIFKSDTIFTGIHPGSYIQFKGTRKYVEGGELVDIARWIDPKYTFLDFLKGISAKDNLKFRTDLNTKTIYLDIPYPGDFWGEQVDGFYTSDLVDYSYKVCETPNIKTPELDGPKSVIVQYKKSKDEYIKSKHFKDPLWSYEKQLRSDNSGEPKRFINPFFEPTLNHTDGIFMIKMNDGKNYGWKFGPRIVTIFDNVEQDYTFLPKIRYSYKFADYTTLIPTAGQLDLVSLGVHDTIGAPFSYRLENLVYGVNPEINFDAPVNLFTLVYIKWILERFNNMEILIGANLTIMDFLEFSFRKKYRFNILDKPTSGRVIEVKDFGYCDSDDPPMLLFIPEKQLTDSCGLVTDVVQYKSCNNNPIILFSESNGCYTFNIVGASSPISTVLYSYSTNGGTTWLNMSGNELCAVDPFSIRAHISYADQTDPNGNVYTCPSEITQAQSITPCPPVELVLSCDTTIDINGNTSVRLVLNQILSLGNINLTGTYTTNGVTYQYLNFQLNNGKYYGDFVPVNHDVQFQIAIDSQCGSYDGELLCEVDSTQEPTTCENTLALSCIETDTDCYIIVKEGSAPHIFDSTIKYRCSEDNVAWSVWKIWDEESPICCGYIEAKWFVSFCDSKCPNICLSTSCGDGCEWEDPMSKSISVCNG